MKYSHHYSKLDQKIYTTVRRYKKGNEGDIVNETYPDGSHKAEILLEILRSLDKMETTFLLNDTDCNTREEAIELINSFYKKPIDLDEKLFVYILQRVNERKIPVSRSKEGI